MTKQELLEAQEMVSDCIDRRQRLSEWELDFMYSLEAQLEARGFCSEKQLNILTRVWERVTARG